MQDMQVTIFHNDARGAFAGFVRKEAALIKVAEFELAAEIAPFVHPGSPEAPATIEAVQAALDAYDAQYIKVLNGIFEQLNIGGDIVPATEYTEAYRAAGNRSLSVGDVVMLGTRAYAVARFGWTKIMNAEARWATIRYDRNADPETKMWRADNAAQVSA